MKDIEQLASATDSAAVGSVIPEIWARRVEEAARANRQARDHVRVNEDLVGGGDVIYLPKRGELSATSFSEGGTITPETLEYDSLRLEPSKYGAGVSVTKTAVNQSQVNLLDDSTEELGQAIAQKEDVEILSQLNTGTTNNLGTVDALTPSRYQELLNEIRDENFEPDTVFLSPDVHYQLATSDQFLDAAKFGNRDVVEEGRVSRFAGADIIVTTNAPVASNDGTTWKSVIAVDSDRAGALAVGQETEVEQDYAPLEQRHKIASTISFDVGLLNDAASARVDVKFV